jgi:PAS domain S-box-containing protein
MASPSGTKIQVLYEIALSIRPGATLAETVRSAVSTYLGKLNCSAGAVFERHESPDGHLEYDLVATLPSQSTLADAVHGAREQFPETAGDLDTLPVVDESDGTHRYIMDLPEFGVLVLVRRGSPLDEDILLSLPELNEKLATACSRVVVQDQYETQYRELFEEAPVMFALTRDEGGDLVVEDCNREFAETLGYDREEIRGRALVDFYTEEARRALEQGGYDRAMAGEFGTAERILQTREGTEISTLLRATPRRDRRGHVVGTNALFVDVTELKRRNQQLTVLNRILRHNIRNDLTAIDGYLEMAMEATDGEARDRLADIAERTRSLLSTTEVADRVRRSLDQTEVTRQDVGEAVEVLVEQAREEFPGASIDADAQSVPVHATAAIDYALWELIENACEHGGSAPHVDIDVYRNGEKATVTVADDGPGIPEQERRILRRGEETQLDHGSGLGLWLVHWVLETSGGSLEFDCEDGTEVLVSLPVAEAESGT